MTGIHGQLKWESLKKRRKDNRLKVLKVKSVYQQMTLFPKLGLAEISTLWHFRLPLLIQMSIKVASSSRLSGIRMPSPIPWSHLLKMQRIVLISSLLWWKQWTNFSNHRSWWVSVVVNYPDPAAVRPPACFVLMFLFKKPSVLLAFAVILLIFLFESGHGKMSYIVCEQPRRRSDCASLLFAA